MGGPCWLLKPGWNWGQMKGVLSWLVRKLGLWCWYKRLLFCLGCSSRPNKILFFPILHYFITIFLIDQEAGRATVLGRLSLCVCLWGPESWLSIPLGRRVAVKPHDYISSHVSVSAPRQRFMWCCTKLYTISHLLLIAGTHTFYEDWIAPSVKFLVLV